MILKKEQVSVFDRSENTKKKKTQKFTLSIPCDKHDTRKSAFSTFANYIHQKDANIAIIMIKIMMNHCGFPCYTVHDNFITTAPNAFHVPNIYCNTYISSLEYPFIMINKFVKENLFENCESAISTNNCEPICPNLLENRLNDLIPKKISKEKRLSWERKIQEICSFYTEYANQVKLDEDDIKRNVNQNTYIILNRSQSRYKDVFRELEKSNTNKRVICMSHVSSAIVKDFMNDIACWEQFPYNYSLHL